MVIYILYRKLLHDNFYTKWDLGWVMAVRLVIDLGELVKVVLKRGIEKSGGWVGEEV
jgi:hypothetical protein